MEGVVEIRPGEGGGSLNAYLSPERKASQPEASDGPVAGSGSVQVQVPGFTNPAVKVDPTSGWAVLLVRNGDTGEVKAEIPAKKVVDEYRSHAQGPKQKAEEQAAPAPAQVAATPAAAAVVAAAVPAPTAAPTPAPAKSEARPPADSVSKVATG